MSTIEITTPSNQKTKDARCKFCQGKIWGIAEVTFVIGTEKPILLHAVCYERLLEYKSMYEGLCK